MNSNLNQNYTVTIECPSRLLIYGAPDNFTGQNSDKNIMETSIKNKTAMLLCNMSRGNPYDNFIHDNYICKNMELII